jgi:hypothetical protein
MTHGDTSVPASAMTGAMYDGGISDPALDTAVESVDEAEKDAAEGFDGIAKAEAERRRAALERLRNDSLDV